MLSTAGAALPHLLVSMGFRLILQCFKQLIDLQKQLLSDRVIRFKTAAGT
jgi:hypothetical protein